MKRLRGELSPETADVHLRSRAPDPPVATTEDGRNVDPSLGVLAGEASALVARHPNRGRSKAPTPDEDATESYYGQPVLKAPVWRAWIPAYFFVGGMAGGSMVLGAAAQLTGGRRLRPIVMPARRVAAGGAVASAALLVADLGRPARFLNMLRVFRPTSPMNMGTWILTGAGAASAAAVALPLLGKRALGDVAGAVAGGFGLGLASYTAVLLVNTAVPAWQHGSRTLPNLFVASAAASAASALESTADLGSAAGSLAVFGAVAKVAELAAGVAYERALGGAGPAVARSLRTGRAGLLFRASQALTIASLAASAFGMRRASGVLGIGGAVALRFAVTDAGRQSAADPRAVVDPQRAELGEPLGARPEPR